MKIGVCGSYITDRTVVGGQNDRTQIIINELQKRKTEYTLNIMNFFSHRTNFIWLIVSTIRLYLENDKILYIVSRRGNIFFTILFGLLKNFKCKELYCVVIGNPTLDFFIHHRLFMHYFKKIDGSFYEIEELAIQIKKLGCEKTYFFPNCKKIRHSENVSQDEFQEPFAVCTYSRITKEKGIIDAIRAVENVNIKLKRQVYQLDIYGKIDARFEAEFKQFLNSSRSANYKGKIDRNDSVEVLKKYYLFLFPTHHTGEGVPGGIIDSLEAGVPIITTNVSYNSSLILDGRIGRVYEEGDPKGLENILLEAIEFPLKYIDMRQNCIEEAENYSVNKCMDQFMKDIGILKNTNA